MGSAHKNESIGKYSFWVRISFCEDVRVSEMPWKEALKKWNAPRRRAREWLNQYDNGKYAGLTTVYTQEELKKKYKLAGGGKKLNDPKLEKILLDYYNELSEELYPISSELLTYDEMFMGGTTAPGFHAKVADFCVLGAEEIRKTSESQQARAKNCPLGTQENGRQPATTST